VHPFSVNSNYPAIHKVFILQGIIKLGNYTTDDKSWTRKHPSILTENERQDRRQWIYRELINEWISKHKIDVLSNFI
jgi:hypothetical protein